jgi:uncharacterized protein YndB with AHSA1/START domain
MQVSHDLEKREFVVSRTFAAPRELVWKMWTECEHLQHWWGPRGWTLPVCTLDLRPGGEWRYGMRGPGGEESFGKGIYQEISAPERLVYTDYFTDGEGKINSEMPSFLITNEFHAQGDKTLVTSRTILPSAEALQSLMDMGMVEGLTQTWDRLEEYLAQI